MRRAAIAFGLACVFGVGALMGSAVGAAPENRARYVLAHDLWGYPGILKVRHCQPSADVMVELRQVSYDRSTGVIVFRCVTP